MDIYAAIGLVSSILGILSFVLLEENYKIKGLVLFFLLGITFIAGGYY